MSARDVALAALFAALTAVLGLFPPLPVPVIPVPITAQSMGPMLAGAILGARRGGFALILFLLLVAAGFPLLSGGRGGFGVFFGPTAGFALSWPLAAAAIGLLLGRAGRPSLPRTILAVAIGGVGLSYAIGVPWLAAVAHLPLARAAMGSAAFLPGDAVKVVVASLVAHGVLRAYPRLSRG